jgi:hypothetical protein
MGEPKAPALMQIREELLVGLRDCGEDVAERPGRVPSPNLSSRRVLVKRSASSDSAARSLSSQRSRSSGQRFPAVSKCPKRRWAFHASTHSSWLQPDRERSGPSQFTVCPA